MFLNGLTTIVATVNIFLNKMTANVARIFLLPHNILLNIRTKSAVRASDSHLADFKLCSYFHLYVYFQRVAWICKRTSTALTIGALLRRTIKLVITESLLSYRLF